MTPTLKLGLIGDNIAASRSPRLHQLLGQQNGIDVTYDRLVPRQMGKTWDEILAALPADGYRGTNVTYPYKEKAAAVVRIDDPLVAGMGAVNTVIFEADGPRGFNTDHSGFMAAYRTLRPTTAPGVVAMIGTGGVGRAVAFGLAGLEAAELRLVDKDPARAEALAEALRAAAPGMAVTCFADAAAAAAGAQGVINCTPVGMVGYEGTPVPRAALAGAEWAFDAVYTPEHTQFLADARAAGLAVLSGWELFFWQGVHAWALFSGKPVDEDALRKTLRAEEAAA
ncbi:shikimate dehydrogenase family protein [Frigidibacter sp. MR17.24]|uniref:shikimate dehydrogenase family protein n=1 Tax=Frigidibacter sp. MR17.24 TaxID=3127345 RepID=UPI003012A4D4